MVTFLVLHFISIIYLASLQWDDIPHKAQKTLFLSLASQSCRRCSFSTALVVFVSSIMAFCYLRYRSTSV
ncbi:hypothetical protein F5Y03DRAFT_335929, partial [Xylaria venustula]